MSNKRAAARRVKHEELKRITGELEGNRKERRSKAREEVNEEWRMNNSGKLKST